MKDGQANSILERDNIKPERQRRSLTCSLKDKSKNRLVFRVRGFEEIYNAAIPREISRLIDRHQFSTSLPGLNYPSKSLQQASMRAIWNLSAKELIQNVRNNAVSECSNPKRHRAQ
jgi:hypothetical protein